MIAFLTWATVAYAVILGLVLAATLITVLWALWGIGTVLGQINVALAQVERHTQPLASLLAPANQGLAQAATALLAARDHLAATDSHLATVVPSVVPSDATAGAGAVQHAAQAPSAARPETSHAVEGKRE
jgi:hypothetical protein